MRTNLSFRFLVPAVLVLLTFSALPALSIDVGGNINSQSTLEDETPAFRNALSLYLARNPVVSTTEPTLRWLAEGSVTAITEQDENEDFETDLVPDVDLLRAELILPELLGAGTSVRSALGRTPYSDRPGLVFSDRLDGARFDLDFRRASVRVGAGYTGLIAGRNSGVVMSVDDSLDRENPDVYSGSRRVITGVGARLREVAGRQNLVVGALAQFDVRDEYVAQKINSQYGYMQLDGPVAGDLYYELGAATSFAQRTEVDVETEELLDDETEHIIGAAGRLQTQLYLGEAEQSVITALAYYGSGPGDGLGSYIPVTPPDIDILSSVSGSDVALAKFNYAFRPFAGQPGARARSLEVSAYGAIDYPADFDVDGDPFRGLESGARVTFRPLSDLGARLVAAGYIPGDDPGELEFLGRLQVSTSF